MRVLVVDDHPVFLDALRLILEGYFEDMVIEGRDSLDEAHDLAASGFDLVIVDLSFRGKDITREVCAWIQANPSAKFLILTSFEDGRHLRMIAEAGAQGFLPKSTPSEILTSVVRLVLAGGRYFPQDLGRHAASKGNGAPPIDRPAPLADGATLSARQVEVFEHLARGLTIADIADRLAVSEPTIKSDIGKATRALSARNRLHAICRAIDAGLIHPHLE